jgi:CheY-like chemotaxis protein
MTADRKKVLIVDDQETVLMIEGRLATFAGYEALTAADGDEALKLARSEPVHLILLDIMLPKMSGIEVLRELKSDPKTRDIPVVVITALQVDKGGDANEFPGAARILSKPVSAGELQEIFRKYLAAQDHPGGESKIEDKE